MHNIHTCVVVGKYLRNYGSSTKLFILHICLIVILNSDREMCLNRLFYYFFSICITEPAFFHGQKTPAKIEYEELLQAFASNRFEILADLKQFDSEFKRPIVFQSYT